MEDEKYYTFDEVLKIVRESSLTNKRYFRRKEWHWFHNDFTYETENSSGPFVNFQDIQANDWYEL